MDSARRKLLSNFFKKINWRYARCLAPGLTCSTAAIRSHSLQNSRVLDLLVRDGHVKALRQRIGDNGPAISFRDVGRNEATTFTGFCGGHDATIFRPIEANPFNSADPEHLLLIAYRAVSRELHALLEGSVKIQDTYLKRVDLGLDSGDEPGPAGMTALDHMIRAYQTHLYKTHFDEVLVTRRYDRVLHDVIQVGHERASIAVCSLFSLDNLFQGDDWVRVAINVLPNSEKESTVVFSYLPNDAPLVRPALNTILSSGGDYQKYLLSKLILNNCENFVVNPAHYDSWSPEKKAAITEFFVKTLFDGDLEVENKHLYLF